jgi:cytochrome bd-type quinol oxidase subunit 2
MADALLAVLILAPLAIVYFLKSNAALGFLALCAGFVLSTSVIGDLKQLLSQANLSVASSTLAAILLVAPFVLTLLLSRKINSKGVSFVLQLITAVCAGGLLALSLGPLLSSSSQFDVTNSSFWADLTKIQAAVIGAGSLLSLLLVWFTLPKPHNKDKKHK